MVFVVSDSNDDGVIPVSDSVSVVPKGFINDVVPNLVITISDGAGITIISVPPIFGLSIDLDQVPALFQSTTVPTSGVLMLTSSDSVATVRL